MEKLEIHYYLEGGVHSMDAFVKNQSEAELLKLLKEISETLNIPIKFESEALKEGGIQDYITFIADEELKNFAMYLCGIATTILTQVAGDYLKRDREMDKLSKEELKLRIQKLRLELGADSDAEEKQEVVQNIVLSFLNLDKIKLLRSNFYSALAREAKVTRISTNRLNEQNEQLQDDKVVTRPEFKKFIIDKIRVKPDEFDDVLVEIVAPVLSRKRIKWKGVYDGKPISFNMLDIVFQQDVVKRYYSFSNGSKIRCSLVAHKEMDSEGNEKVTKIEAFAVTQVIYDDFVFNTEEERARRSNVGQNNS